MTSTVLKIIESQGSGRGES